MEHNYLEVLYHIYKRGIPVQDRTGVGTHKVFGERLKFDLDRFPLLTTKKVNWNAIVDELLWFIKGSTNVTDLETSIWDDWADKDGDLGPIYGQQWRSIPQLDVNWSYVGVKDQLLELENSLKNNPNSRRHLMVSYNPCMVDAMALPACHALVQFDVTEKYLNCQMYQRSADMFLGVPFNIASYSLLTYMLASTCNLKPGNFIHVLGDAHIYNNHRSQVEEQLKRTIRPFPKVRVNPLIDSIVHFTKEDIILEEYDPHPAIRAPIAV